MPRARQHHPDVRGLRLAVVLDAALPWNNGGKEQRHHELLTRLAARGAEVTVYTMRWWDGPPRIRRDGITYVAICPRLDLYAGERRSIVQGVVYALCCLRLLLARFDVVEADAIPFLHLPVVRLVATLRRRPMVTTWHEFWGREYWREYLGGGRGRVAAAVEAAAVRIPDVVVAASTGTADRLTAAGLGADRVVAVPNGVGEHGVAPRAEAGCDLEAGVRLVGAGRLLHHKRFDVAVEAVARLRSDGVPASLEIFGQGPARAALEERAARPDLDGAVAVRDFLPEHADVLHAFAAADVVAFPSEREGFGMVALEAMSVGTPVITSDHDDNEARHLVRPGVNGAVCGSDPDDFAAAVRQVASARPSLAAGALETAAGYRWDALADQVGAVYADAARSRSGLPRRRS